MFIEIGLNLNFFICLIGKEIQLLNENITVLYCCSIGRLSFFILQNEILWYVCHNTQSLQYIFGYIYTVNCIYYVL